MADEQGWDPRGFRILGAPAKRKSTFNNLNTPMPGDMPGGQMSKSENLASFSPLPQASPAPDFTVNRNPGSLATGPNVNAVGAKGPSATSSALLRLLNPGQQYYPSPQDVQAGQGVVGGQPLSEGGRRPAEDPFYDYAGVSGKNTPAGRTMMTGLGMTPFFPGPPGAGLAFRALDAMAGPTTSDVGQGWPSVAANQQARSNDYLPPGIAPADTATKALNWAKPFLPHVLPFQGQALTLLDTARRGFVPGKGDMREVNSGPARDTRYATDFGAKPEPAQSGPYARDASPWTDLEQQDPYISQSRYETPGGGYETPRDLDFSGGDVSNTSSFGPYGEFGGGEAFTPDYGLDYSGESYQPDYEQSFHHGGIVFEQSPEHPDLMNPMNETAYNIWGNRTDPDPASPTLDTARSFKLLPTNPSAVQPAKIYGPAEYGPEAWTDYAGKPQFAGQKALNENSFSTIGTMLYRAQPGSQPERPSFAADNSFPWERMGGIMLPPDPSTLPPVAPPEGFPTPDKSRRRAEWNTGTNDWGQPIHFGNALGPTEEQLTTRLPKPGQPSVSPAAPPPEPPQANPFVNMADGPGPSSPFDDLQPRRGRPATDEQVNWNTLRPRYGPAFHQGGMVPGGDEDHDGRRNVQAMLEEGETVIPAPGTFASPARNKLEALARLAARMAQAMPAEHDPVETDKQKRSTEWNAKSLLHQKATEGKRIPPGPDPNIDPNMPEAQPGPTWRLKHKWQKGWRPDA